MVASTARSIFGTAVAAALALSACGDDALKAEGEECFGSSECAAGLVCDFNATPHVCRTMQTPLPDAAPDPVDAAPQPDAPAGQPDAAPGQPDAAPGQPDAAPGQPDAAPPTPDAAPPPDAAPTPDA